MECSEGNASLLQRIFVLDIVPCYWPFCLVPADWAGVGI